LFPCVVSLPYFSPNLHALFSVCFVIFLCHMI
jgi:hypothetical protein